MRHGQADNQWEHTASLWAAILNTTRSKQSDRLWVTDDFHPMRQGKSKSGGTPLKSDNIEMLKVFVRK